jgi:hypothetical protein
MFGNGRVLCVLLPGTIFLAVHGIARLAVVDFLSYSRIEMTWSTLRSIVTDNVASFAAGVDGRTHDGVRNEAMRER